MSGSIIKKQIERYYNFEVEVVDSANIVASSVKAYLQENNLLRTGPNPQYKFYISDYTDYFEKISKMFFEEKIHLEELNFWK